MATLWDSSEATSTPTSGTRSSPPGKDRTSTIPWPTIAGSSPARPARRLSSAISTWATAGAGGDDFLDSHVLPDEQLGVHTGFAPGGESCAGVFSSVLSFALDRIARACGAAARLDVVLNGDIINVLELKGRGSALVSPKHKLLFRALAAVRAMADVFWLRGNHDYVVPTGPWQNGEFYVNPHLQLLAEHGDFWDKQNWPPGPDNKGSRLVIEAAALFEVQAQVQRDHTVKYLLSGIDNLRPLTNDTIEGFLDRRSKFSDVAALAALIARLHFLGAADDYAAYEGGAGAPQEGVP